MLLFENFQSIASRTKRPSGLHAVGGPRV